MSASQIASTIEIVPTTLGEDEFVSPDGRPRRIKVNMAAGTITVAFDGPADSDVFTWCVPCVLLGTLTPLVEELTPYVRRALAGAVPRPPDPRRLSFTLTDDAESELAAADGLVADFYRRWTGREMTTLRCARCSKCGSRIVHAMNLTKSRWLIDVNDFSRCANGGEHEPYPSGEPYAPRALAPGHELSLEPARRGRWSGKCECGAWEQTARDWRSVAIGHYLHAEAIPPDAPFEP